MTTVWFTHARTGNEKGFVSNVSADDMLATIKNRLDEKKAVCLQNDNEAIIVPFELLQQCFIVVDDSEDE